MQHNEWITQYKRVLKIIDDYEHDRITLKKSEEADMWKTYREIKKLCPHDAGVHRHFRTYGDDEYGYSTHSDYCEIRCCYCDETLETFWHNRNHSWGTCFINAAYNHDNLWGHDKWWNGEQFNHFVNIKRDGYKLHYEAYRCGTNMVQDAETKMWIREEELPPPPPPAPPKPPEYLSVLDALESKLSK